MSTAHYDLAARLRAASTARPVPRAAASSITQLRAPVAITLQALSGGGFALSATTPTPEAAPQSSASAGTGACGPGFRTERAHGADALRALAAVGVGVEHALPKSRVRLTGAGGAPAQQAPEHAGADGEDGDDELVPSWRTLVVADHATLAMLGHLVADVAPGGPWEAQAAIVDWWLARADHPGSPSVLVVPSACAQRWILGEAPEAERTWQTWARWLGTDCVGPASGALGPGSGASPAARPAGIDGTGESLLRLAAKLDTGSPLPGAHAVVGREDRSWTYLLDRIAAGVNFRKGDNLVEASMGLTTRCQAAELWESMRLHDPLVADRARFDGTVLTGQVCWVAAREPEFEVLADRLVSRFRAGQVVTGTYGASGSCAGGQFTATVVAARIGQDGRLVVTLGQVVQHKLKTRALVVRPGVRVQVRPEPVGAQQQEHGKRNLSTRYRDRGNWMVRATPPPRAPGRALGRAHGRRRRRLTR